MRLLSAFAPPTARAEIAPTLVAAANEGVAVAGGTSRPRVRAISVALLTAIFLCAAANSTKAEVALSPIDDLTITKIDDGHYELSGGVYRLTSAFDLMKYLEKNLPSMPNEVEISGNKTVGTTFIGSKTYQPRHPNSNELPTGLPAQALIIDADASIRSMWEAGEEKELGCAITSQISLFEVAPGSNDKPQFRRLDCARWPVTGYAVSDQVQYDAAQSKLTFASPAPLANSHGPLGSKTLRGYVGHNWSYDSASMIDFNSHTTTVFWDSKHYPPTPNFRYALYGIPETMSSGQFISDPAHGKIYVIPKLSPHSTFEIPIIPKNPSVDWQNYLVYVANAHNLSLKNITIGLHNGSGLLIKNSSQIGLESLHIQNVNKYGISIAGGERVTVDHSVFEDIGSDGVAIYGGNRDTLTPSSHKVLGSVFKAIGVLERTYHPAVNIHGVGQEVKNNFIYDLPHGAILFGGNDHVISGNKIMCVMTETDDVGAIYAGRDWTSRGTTISKNYFYGLNVAKDILSMHSNSEVHSVYLDDTFGGTDVSDNIFVKDQVPIMQGGGRDNIISNNLFIQSIGPAISMDRRGVVRKEMVDRLFTALANSPYQSPIWRQRYPALAALASSPSDVRGDANDPRVPLGVKVQFNVLYGDGTSDNDLLLRRNSGTVAVPPAILAEQVQQNIVESGAQPAPKTTDPRAWVALAKTAPNFARFKSAADLIYANEPGWNALVDMDTRNPPPCPH